MAPRIDARPVVRSLTPRSEVAGSRQPQSKAAPGDSFETPRSRPVELKPTETAAQERTRRVGELHRVLEQVKTAQPPLTEAQVAGLLGVKNGEVRIDSSKLDKATMRGVLNFKLGILQYARARTALAENNPAQARAYLDMDSDPYEGVGALRSASSQGLTSQELGPLARAQVELMEQAFGAVNPEQERLNASAQQTLGLGKEVSDYFLSKNKVMSQGGGVQAVCEHIVNYTQKLEQALAMPLTDGNRKAAVENAQANLDQYLAVLGLDPVKRLEAGRRNTIDTLNNLADLVGQVPTPITRGGALLARTAANGLEYASGDITGNQLFWKEAAALVDAAGGQATQKLGAMTKVLADAGVEFTKSLAAELAKIDPKLPASEQERLTKIATRTALHNAVTGALTDFAGASFGEAGKKFTAELVRVAVASIGGAVSTAANEYNKTAFDKNLTPEQRAAQLGEVAWKAVTNAVKTASEGIIEAIKR